jgi:hypothetical protein
VMFAVRECVCVCVCVCVLVCGCVPEQVCTTKGLTQLDVGACRTDTYLIRASGLEWQYWIP